VVAPIARIRPAAAQLPTQGELAAMRAYLRQRERLLDYAASHIQHMQKSLMQMNVQLHHVVTDIPALGNISLEAMRQLVRC
jgi:transposase